MRISPVSCKNYQTIKNYEIKKQSAVPVCTRKNAVEETTFKGNGGALKGIVLGAAAGVAAAGGLALAGGIAAFTAAGVTTAALLGCGGAVGANVGGIIGGMVDDTTYEELCDKIEGFFKKKNK